MKIIKSTLAPFLHVDDFLPLGDIIKRCWELASRYEIKTRIISPSVIRNCYASLLSLKYVHRLLFIHRCTFFVPIQIMHFKCLILFLGIYKYIS